MRKAQMTMQLPTFTYYEDMGMNFVYVFKHKLRKINHWASGGEYLRVLAYGYYTGATFNTRTDMYFRKYDYGSPVRGFQNFPGQGGWDICAWTITPANELGESVESSYTVHVLQSPFMRTQTEYRLSCSLSQVTGTRQYSSGYPGT